MKLSKQELAAIFDDASDFNGSNEQAFDARKALEAGTLEIEGYERTEWTKFDPNDTKTFPPCNGTYWVFRSVEPRQMESNFYGEKAGFAVTCITHWRPLPKPPGKEEAK